MSASSDALVESAMRQYPALLALGRSLVGSDGCDVVQDALLQAVGHDRPVARPLSWFRTVIRNRAKSSYRGATRRAARESRWSAPQEAESPETLVQRSEILDALVQEWSALGEPYVEALRLRFEEGLTARAIGERQGCPTNTASWRVREGICRLRARLDARFGERKHWLGALVAVPGVASGVPQTAPANPPTMKPLTIAMLSSVAIAVSATAYAYSTTASDDAAAAPSFSRSAVSKNAASNLETTQTAPGSSETSSRSVAVGAARTATPSPMTLTSVVDEALQYGSMIETRGQGLEACGEEISELSSVARDIYPGCMAAAGYDPAAAFSFHANFALDEEGVSHLGEIAATQSGEEARELARCLSSELFDDVDAEHLPGFEGRLQFGFRLLNDDEISPAAIAARVAEEDVVEISSEGLAWQGEADAATTIIECVDPDCPFARRVAPTLDRLLDEQDGDVRIAQLQSPQPMHEGAQRKAQALVVANRYDQYWNAADYLHMHPGPMNDADFRAMAKALKLDAPKFMVELDGANAVREVARQSDACEQAGARGTPTFFIDGHRLAGAQPFDVFDAAIKAVRGL